MKQSNDYHMNVGGASMILLLVVFSMTVFAALSVRASLHELRLADKTRTAVEDYYELDRKAEEIRVMLGSEGVDVSDIDGKYNVKVQKPDGSTFSYTVTSDTTGSKLSVTLYKTADGGLKVKEWILLEPETGDYGTDGGEGLWNGEIVIIE